MIDHPGLHEAILSFYERLGVVDEVSEEVGEDTLMGEAKIEKHVTAIVKSHEHGIAPLGPEDIDLEDLATRWMAWVTDHMSGYAIAELVARGDVLPMVDRETGEFTFLHRKDARRIMDEEAAA